MGLGRLHAARTKLGWLAAASCIALGMGQPALADVLFENITLIDGTGGAPLPNSHVLVRGERIAMVSPRPLEREAGLEVIDGRGNYLLPGLIDTHVHLQNIAVPEEGRGGARNSDPGWTIEALHGLLYCGVTAMYDAGNFPAFILPFRERERRGDIQGPRIFASGSPITVAGGYGAGPWSIIIDDWKVSKPQLEAYFEERKPDLQKLLVDRHGIFAPRKAVPSLELMRGIVQLANAHGIRTTVHAATEEDFLLSLDAGVDAFAHVIRYPASDELITRLSAKKIPVSSTLVAFNYISRIAEDASFLDSGLFTATVSRRLIEREKTEERRRFIQSGMAAQFTVMREIPPTNARRLFEAGGILTLGTDRSWGATVHMELELLHRAGIPLPALVRIATLNGARYLGLDADLGSVERGKFADLLVLSADPTVDVKNYQAIEAVYKAGKRIDRSKLDIPANR